MTEACQNKVFPIIRFCVFSTFIVYTLIFLLISPLCAAESVRNALTICFNKIIPTLFPFLIISSLCLKTGFAQKITAPFSKFFSKLFGISEVSSFAFLSGIVFGFPIGGKISADLYNEGLIQKNECENLICFCSNTGPAFVISVVGDCLSNRKIGYIIYLSQLISACIIGILLKKSNKPLVYHHSDYKKQSYLSAIPEAVSSSVIPMLTICGFICFFSVVSSSLNNALSLFGVTDKTEALICGFIEITGGIDRLSYINNDISFLFASFFVGWSGISVILQTYAFSEKLGIPLKKYITSKFFQGVICSVITFVILKIFNL